MCLITTNAGRIEEAFEYLRSRAVVCPEATDARIATLEEIIEVSFVGVYR